LLEEVDNLAKRFAKSPRKKGRKKAVRKKVTVKRTPYTNQYGASRAYGKHAVVRPINAPFTNQHTIRR
jgi:hypothetical protein